MPKTGMSGAQKRSQQRAQAAAQRESEAAARSQAVGERALSVSARERGRGLLRFSDRLGAAA